jgi:hypothetical protein
MISVKFENADNFTDGLAKVEKYGKCGYIDSTGNFVIEPKYEKAQPFINNLARVKLNGSWGFIDKSGQLLGNESFFNAEDFADDLARVRDVKGWGYIDRQGNRIIPTQFYAAGNFDHGIARVKVNPDAPRTDKDEWIFIDKSGKKLFEKKYFEKAENFCNGTARVRVNGLWGYINEKGEFDIKPQFERCLDFMPINLLFQSALSNPALEYFMKYHMQVE